MSTSARLARYQRRLLDQVAADDSDYRRQFHPDLSPSGWHLGHCVFTENYWIREVIGGQPLAVADRDLYVPELSRKPARGRRLPGFAELIDWAGREQRTNARRLGTLQQRRRHPLLQGGFLETFLVQHYAQHYETLCYLRAQRQRQQAAPPPDLISFAAERPDPDDSRILPAGDYAIGQPRPGRPYDNEHPRHSVRLDGCRLARRPLSNAAMLGFMMAGGYDDPAFWSAPGWRWRQSHNIQHPDYWQRSESGHWYGIDSSGSHALQPHEPVCGLSYYEATAIARWAGGRLAHEHEWEAAARAGLLECTGRVWEWCANAFYPYDGFHAYPYDGYSMPYFDNQHYVLRGGSRYTRRVIKRASFRNYYLPDKRYPFSGLRLAFD